ncbi:MAG: adenine deaminase [Candidatus Margulisiibacteriota bacterium]
MKDYIQAAEGKRKADILLKNGQLVNVLSGEIYPSNVVIYKDMIVGISSAAENHWEVEKTLDLNGKYILPGLMDAYIRMEASLLHPAEFVRAAVAQGTTAVIADPHEIANVLGVSGIKYIMDATRNLPVDVYFIIPSRVPATPLETSGASLKLDDLLPFLKKDRVFGLAEDQDYSDVLGGEKEILKKIMQARGHVIDGNCPGLSGKDLNAYLVAGISSDHAASSVEEAIEKVRKGMWVYVRQGSSFKEVKALAPFIARNSFHFLCFCTDDISPRDLSLGHVNGILRDAVAAGVDAMTAVRMATLSPCCRYCLQKRGAVAPGYFADIVVVSDLIDFKVDRVFKDGVLVVERGNPVYEAKIKRKSIVKETMNVKELKAEKLAVKATSDAARVIQIMPGEIMTKTAKESVLVKEGFVVSDIERDILKLAVVERHKGTGKVSLGLVRGFGIIKGAIASSISHDSHNLICVGVNDEDMLSALRQVVKLKGGVVVVSGGLITAELALPVAGLMSEELLHDVDDKMQKIEKAIQDMGSKLDNAVEALSYLALPTIPELRLSDLGLVDVDAKKIVPLFDSQA